MIDLCIEDLKKLVEGVVEEMEATYHTAITPPECILKEFDKDSILGLVCNCPRCTLT